MSRQSIKAKLDYAEYLASDEWRARRDEAVQRAEGRCQLCNSSKRLNVHHRTYKRRGKELPSDLTVLCDECHRHFHGITNPDKVLHVVEPPKKIKKRSYASNDAFAARERKALRDTGRPRVKPLPPKEYKPWDEQTLRDLSAKQRKRERKRMRAKGRKQARS